MIEQHQQQQEEKEECMIADAQFWFEFLLKATKRVIIYIQWCGNRIDYIDYICNHVYTIDENYENIHLKSVNWFKLRIQSI